MGKQVAGTGSTPVVGSWYWVPYSYLVSGTWPAGSVVIIVAGCGS